MGEGEERQRDRTDRAPIEASFFIFSGRVRVRASCRARINSRPRIDPAASPDLNRGDLELPSNCRLAL